MAGKYDFGYEVYHGSTVEWALGVVRPHSSVLEFGPFNGNLTKHLQENLNCVVDIVELNQEAGEAASRFSRDALLGPEEGNIESFYWETYFSGRQYDYVVFLDVIEHLVPTKEILRRVQPFLKEDGAVLLSIPNVAYNGVLINLLNNRFPYTELGLLDCTHLRFFTYESILALAKELGYSASIEALQLPIAASETKTSYGMVPEHVAHFLQQKEFANVYQYLVTLTNGEEKADAPRLKLENVDNRVEVCVYLKTAGDSEFSEQKKTWVFVQAGPRLSATLDLSSYGTVQELRLDPMTCPCFLKNISVTAQTLEGETRELPVNGSNGAQIEDGILFATEDPQIYFEPQNQTLQEIHFACEVESYDRETIGKIVGVFHWEQHRCRQMETHFENSLKQAEEARVKTERMLKQEQETRTKTEQLLEQEREAQRQAAQSLREEQLEHGLTQRKLELAQNDLRRILWLKEQSEEKLYEIETSRAWHWAQKLRKIKHFVLGR